MHTHTYTQGLNCYSTLEPWMHHHINCSVYLLTLHTDGDGWMNEYGVLVEWYRQGKTKVLGKNMFQCHCGHHISWDCEVRGQGPRHGTARHHTNCKCSCVPHTVTMTCTVFTVWAPETACGGDNRGGGQQDVCCIGCLRDRRRGWGAYTRLLEEASTDHCGCQVSPQTVPHGSKGQEVAHTEVNHSTECHSAVKWLLT